MPLLHYLGRQVELVVKIKSFSKGFVAFNRNTLCCFGRRDDLHYHTSDVFVGYSNYFSTSLFLLCSLLSFLCAGRKSSNIMADIKWVSFSQVQFHICFNAQKRCWSFHRNHTAVYQETLHTEKSLDWKFVSSMQMCEGTLRQLKSLSVSHLQTHDHAHALFLCSCPISSCA